MAKRCKLVQVIELLLDIIKDQELWDEGENSASDWVYEPFETSLESVATASKFLSENRASPGHGPSATTKGGVAAAPDPKPDIQHLQPRRPSQKSVSSETMDYASAVSRADQDGETENTQVPSTDSPKLPPRKKPGKERQDVEDIIRKIREKVKSANPNLHGAAFDAEVLREAETKFQRAEARALEDTSDSRSIVTVKPAVKQSKDPQSNPIGVPGHVSEELKPLESEVPLTNTHHVNRQSKPINSPNASQTVRSETAENSTFRFSSQSDLSRNTSSQQHKPHTQKRRGKKRGSSVSQAARQSQSQSPAMTSEFKTNLYQGVADIEANDPFYHRGEPIPEYRENFGDGFPISISETSQLPRLTLSNLEALENDPALGDRSIRRGQWTGASSASRSRGLQNQEHGRYQFNSSDPPSTIPSRRGISQYETQSGTRTTRDGKEGTKPRNAWPLKGPYKDLGESSEESDGAASDEIIKDNKYRSHWTGEAQKLINKYKCHFPDCPNSQPARGFKNIQGLREHKRFCHDICEKCKMEFLDFQALLAHKQMSENHIACWFCGKDFHTAPARERHMMQVHPDLKDLECPGCGQMFHSSASFVRHVERNECQGITDDQFNKARLMITKVKDIAVVEQVESSEPPQGAKRPPGLDLENDEDFPGLPGLDLRKKLPNHTQGGQKSNYEAPHKPVMTNPGATNELIKKLESMSTAGPLTNVAIEPHQKRLLEVYKKMIGSNHGVYEPPLNMDGMVVYEGIPDHALYNPAIFKNPFGKFNCPHAFCTKSWKNQRALDSHLKSSAHKCRDFRCPECCNVFNTADAIVAHFESPSAHCKIRHSHVYKEAMEIASGSFLTASHDFFGNVKVETQEPIW